MGKNLLQVGRLIMTGFWFVFILLALNMARMAWPSDSQGPSAFITVIFFIVAAYAGLGMLIGIVTRFLIARDDEEGSKIVGI